jgi:hypothetical protein
LVERPKAEQLLVPVILALARLVLVVAAARAVAEGETRVPLSLMKEQSKQVTRAGRKPVAAGKDRTRDIMTTEG